MSPRAHILQMFQQQGSAGIGFGNGRQASQTEEDEQEHIVTMELFRRLSHSETSPTPLSKMGRTLSCGGVPSSLNQHSGASKPASSLPHMGRFKPSLSSGANHPNSNPQQHGNMQHGSSSKEAHDQGGGNFDLPTSIVLTPNTDAMQAAGLINLALSQPGASSFLLKVQPQQTGKQAGKQAGKGSRGLVATAISVILATKKVRGGSSHKSGRVLLCGVIA